MLWFKKWKKVMTGVRFIQSDFEQCMFHRDGVWVGFYVDDNIIVGPESSNV